MHAREHVLVRGQVDPDVLLHLTSISFIVPDCILGLRTRGRMNASVSPSGQRDQTSSHRVSNTSWMNLKGCTLDDASTNRR